MIKKKEVNKLIEDRDNLGINDLRTRCHLEKYASADEWTTFFDY
jgi:hypothetical protein